MSTEKMRELDSWIAEHVMGWEVKHKDHEVQFCYEGGKVSFINFRPTTDPAAAMLVLEKCAEKADKVCIIKGSVFYKVYHRDKALGATGEAETLPLAICLFARQLFTK